MNRNFPKRQTSQACRLAIGAWILGTIWLGSGNNPLLAAERPFPDFVVFLSDDHSQLDSTPYGATNTHTPNMQKLAQDGLKFTQAFVASPACSPSRAAFLTGLMPARNGAEANHSYKREGITSLPEVLHQLGYQTAAFGKVAHGKDVTQHGFDTHDPQHDAQTVEKFLKNRDKSKPLCLFVGTHEPHVPWPDLEGYDPQQVKLSPTQIDTPSTREYRARYLTDVTKADTLLGEVRALSRQYLDSKNTLFIYTSDHGAQWPFGKWNLYDAGIRVPFIAAWEGVIQPGTSTDAMIQWIDILPTLIAAAGGKVPANIDGRSFLPVLKGESQTHRDVIFTTHSGDGRMNVYPIRSIRTADWKFILNLHPEFAHTTHIDKVMGENRGTYWLTWLAAAKSDPAAKALVDRYFERPAVKLYDLKHDPYELHNLAADQQQSERVTQMRKQLEDWMKSQGDQQTVFAKPRLLSDPESKVPGTEAQNFAAPKKKPPAIKK